MIDALVCRGQQIGQIEILGALAPYLSAPELFAGKQVIHWVDNTSALSAMTKGYSGVPDSARLVHLFHAWNLGARAACWFEYVPTAANPADKPSRVDLASRACIGGGLGKPAISALGFLRVFLQTAALGILTMVRGGAL